MNVLILCLFRVKAEEIKFRVDHHTSIDEVKEYLLSIGFNLQDVCEAETASKRVLETLEVQEGQSPFFLINCIMAVFCVLVAALAAGLTMGLVSQELLDLRIKEVAGNQEEKEQARSLIPLLQDHHRLLVTLLLINAMANEALPLFLDKIVPAYMAVILSVTLVLFFGEIIPNAIFSGPNKLAVSSRLAPVVKVLLLVFYPLAWPIGKLLDKVLHEDDEEGFMQKYNRKELSALVRLQFEERQASKLRMKMDRANAGLGASNKYVRHIDTVNSKFALFNG
jgi:metal transporter CNNM